MRELLILYDFGELKLYKFIDDVPEILIMFNKVTTNFIQQNT